MLYDEEAVGPLAQFVKDFLRHRGPKARAFLSTERRVNFSATSLRETEGALEIWRDAFGERDRDRTAAPFVGDEESAATGKQREEKEKEEGSEVRRMVEVDEKTLTKRQRRAGEDEEREDEPEYELTEVDTSSIPPIFEYSRSSDLLLFEVRLRPPYSL